MLCQQAHFTRLTNFLQSDLVSSTRSVIFVVTFDSDSYTMGNPVKINHDQPCTRRIGILMLLSLFVLSIVILAKGGSVVDGSCVGGWTLAWLPVWMFLYYRLYSRLLCKVLDCCSCCEHGICYAFWNYAIWGKEFTSFSVVLPLYTDSLY